MSVDSFLSAAAAYKLGHLQANAVVDAAAQQLTEMTAPPAALAELATADATDIRYEELDDLIQSVLAGLGEPPLTNQRATATIIVSIARKVANGTIDAISGAREIWRLAPPVSERSPEINSIISLVDDWEENANAREGIIGEVQDAARELLNRG
jgi:hypothetical protein